METTSEQVCQDLLGLIGRLKSGLARLSEPYELTAMQLHALYAILQGDTTMGQVAESLHCDASNVTGIVDRLVAGQFITREEGARDRRTKTLHLTAKGQRAVADVYSKLPAQLGCSRLDARDRATLHDIVTKIIDVRAADPSG
jgi:DNA-binding MarR family transcriptional regulator